MKNLLFALASLCLVFSCKQTAVQAPENPLAAYFKLSGTGIQNGGVQVVEIQTPKGKFKVWTKRFGQNPKVKVLLLAGGPGCTHEYWECMESYLPAEGIEFIYYDQLGCGFSDNPKDTALWDLPRYVEEVEQVRLALGLTKDNFYLLGHSWGGILAAEYALKYQQNLRGLIISNMMMSASEYAAYAEKVLAPQMPPAVLDSIRLLEKAKAFDNPRYMGLLMPHFYGKHICRIPLAEWPEPVHRSIDKINESLYVTMQGPSEFGISGKLEHWERVADLPKIQVPTLVIGATHDTMDPAHMKMVSEKVAHGQFLLCPNGGHMCMWDDQQTYMAGLIAFLKA